jgi:hypothetical protein
MIMAYDPVLMMLARCPRLDHSLSHINDWGIVSSQVHDILEGACNSALHVVELIVALEDALNRRLVVLTMRLSVAILRRLVVVGILCVRLFG